MSNSNFYIDEKGEVLTEDEARAIKWIAQMIRKDPKFAATLADLDRAQCELTGLLVNSSENSASSGSIMSKPEGQAQSVPRNGFWKAVALLVFGIYLYSLI